MSVIATPMRGQPPFLAPARTIDRSTEQPMPDYGEPILAPTGIPDELAPSYVRAYAAAYQKAHAEADAAEEAESLRNELASLDWSPAQFAAYVADQCPGVLYSMTATQYVATSAEGGVKIETRYEGWVNFPGASTRNIPADSWRGLAEKMVAEFKMRRGLCRVPVVEVPA
jgi:hypothetical protein